MWQVVSGIGALPRCFAICEWRQHPSPGGGFQSTDLTHRPRPRTPSGGRRTAYESIRLRPALREIVENIPGGEVRIKNLDGRYADSDTQQSRSHRESPKRDRK
jgi:hypothetical protein